MGAETEAGIGRGETGDAEGAAPVLAPLAGSGEASETGFRGTQVS